MELQSYQVVENRQSLRSVLPRTFAYVDYYLTGTHELPRATNTALAYDSLTYYMYSRRLRG
jgi:hypothetical protein